MYAISGMGNATSKTAKPIRPFNMSRSAFNKLTMISAWRYPGKSKPGKLIPIPDDILQEIKDVWFV